MFRYALIMCAVGCATAPISADTVLLGTSRDTLHRVTQTGGGDVVESFLMSDRIRSMHRDDSGTVYAIGKPDVPAGPTPIYTVENAAAGTPFLTFVATLSQPYAATVRIDDTIYAIQKDNDFYTIDVSGLPGLTETLVGPTGVVTPNAAFTGAAYDPTSDTLYAISTLSSAQFVYTIDRGTGVATAGAPLNVVGGQMGADWFDGSIYAMFHDNGTNRSLMGTVDPLTGDFTMLYDLGPKPAGVVTASMVVIPEPSTVALLLIVAAVRRRRS